ncbi:MAG: orotate phosphoribosyltransferase [Candidatus Dadabacteria bacterium]|nr:MAG: orotate phosphoribosyltransferase [Candidatus Dadabacteria bacterium]
MNASTLPAQLQLSNQEGRTRLADILRERSVRTGNFTLASGKQSDLYVDVRKTSLDPEGAWWIGRLFTAELADYPDVEAVGGPTLGADPLTTATSLAAWTLGRRLLGFLIRKQAKGHGTGRWIEGPDLADGTPVVLLEDVLTTGGSALQACERVRAHGLNICAVFAVVDREEGGRQAIEEAGYPVRALFTRSELLS